jgi:Nif-specific regulatory protein
MSEVGRIDRHAINLTGLESSPQFGTGMGGTASQIDIDDPELDERERVIAALEQTGWVQAKAARLLGMTPRQIGYRIQTLNIKVRHI